MEWRCAWCGKPYESDDPPCDNCGHDTFEKAVERVAAPGQAQGTVWICPECGRQHQRNSPPCSRCGNLELEQRDFAELDDPLDDIGTRWRDVIEVRYVLGYLAVGVLLVVLALGALGVVDLPGFGEPSIPDAPGSAETAGNLSLDAVEQAVVATTNDRRRNATVTTLDRDETLDRVAAYYNKGVVRATYDEGSGPDPDALRRFDPECDGRPTLMHAGGLSGSGGSDQLTAAANEATVASALVAALEAEGGDAEFGRADAELVGVDVHVAPDGNVFVTVAFC